MLATPLKINYPEYEHGIQQGKGIFYRTPGKLAPKSRELLSRVGNEVISSIVLVRTPLASKKTINLLTNNKLSKVLKDLNIDEVFHLALLINNKYLLDKQSTVHFEVDKDTIQPDSQTLVVPIEKPITIQALINNTLAQMGPDKFSEYDARNNNCSVFISNILSANGLQNPKTELFINQRTEDIFSKFPSFAKYVLRGFTDIGQIVDRWIHGNGTEDAYTYD